MIEKLIGILFVIILVITIFSLFKKNFILKKQIKNFKDQENYLKKNIRTKFLAQKRLIKEIDYDYLTKIYNRKSFIKYLDLEIKLSKKNSKNFAVFFLDVNSFKKINDNFGHLAGDEFLKILATRLKKSIRDSDIVARIGGDEFAILLKDVHSKESIVNIANKITNSLEEKMNYENQSSLLSISLGVSCYPCDANNSIDLLNKADLAMYVAKKNKKENSISFYKSKKADISQKIL